jgi:hypothetical protein
LTPRLPAFRLANNATSWGVAFMESIIHRAPREKRPYARSDLEVVRNPEVSGLAKALHQFACSQKEGWELRMAHIKKHFKEKEDAIYAALANLEDQGYLLRLNTAGKKGQFRGVIYHWYEQAIPKPKRKRYSKQLVEEVEPFRA